MTYHLKDIKTFSKFWVLDINRNIKKVNKSKLDLSFLFWNHLFDKNTFLNFFNNKYLKFIKEKVSEDDLKWIIKEVDFIVSKLDFIKNKIDFINEKKVPQWDDIFFSFRIFTTILYYYNNYYEESNISINLRSWINYLNWYSTVLEFINNINQYSNSKFVNELLIPLLEKNITEDKKLYKFDIFWPDEIISVSIISLILKKINFDNKIVIDFSAWNEQFDFWQWVDLIKNSWTLFFNYIDFFAINRDFWTWILDLVKKLNWEKNIEEVQNIMYFNNEVIYNPIKENEFNNDLFQNFIDATFNSNKISILLWEKSHYSRFLPYKCYWSNCSFCAINSQNKFIYDRKYSYDYFIDRWIDFIKDNNIKSLNFKDEAIPPLVIIKFAKKVIANWLKINYQFRTRFEKLYTYENCKILADSWCWYCWIWLESAVDRINETIWNKWNDGITIKDKVKIIHNFDKAWVGFHNYSIIWFPWETDKEAAITYKFLKDNIINSWYYTCTPNIFWLMKWPRIFSEMKQYWIEVDKKDLNNPFKLNFEFTHNWKKRNLNLLKKFEENLHKTQFLPWLTNNSFISWRDFWDYIDRSYIFYLLKRYHEINPFYKYKNININIL